MASELVFDSKTEERIEREVIADAHNEYERAIKWISYLEHQLTFPFEAQCLYEMSSSPLKESVIVSVIGLNTKLSVEEMFVTVNWQDKTYDVPLSQLEGIDADNKTLQGITDWHYWVSCGYSF